MQLRASRRSAEERKRRCSNKLCLYRGGDEHFLRDCKLCKDIPMNNTDKVFSFLVTLHVINTSVHVSVLLGSGSAGNLISHSLVFPVHSHGQVSQSNHCERCGWPPFKQLPSHVYNTTPLFRHAPPILSFNTVLCSPTLPAPIISRSAQTGKQPWYFPHPQIAFHPEFFFHCHPKHYINRKSLIRSHCLLSP